MELKVKIWLASEAGEGLLGEGRYRLLRQVDECKSLQEAAKKLKISYRKAWGDIRTMEKRLGFELVDKKRGGKGGGESTLTEKAKKILAVYGQAKEDVAAMANMHYINKIKKILEE